MTDFLYATADFLQMTFVDVLEPLGSLPNDLFLLIGFIATGYWLYLQVQLTKKAKDEGGIV